MDDAEPSHGGRILPELSNIELVARLQMSRCTGVLWLRTADRVVSYGTGTLRRRLLDGSINTKLARLRCPVQLSTAEREHLRIHLLERRGSDWRVGASPSDFSPCSRNCP